MAQATTEQVTSVKQITDDQMVENFGLAGATHGETPHFGKSYSMHLWDRFYRINYFSRADARISRSLFVAVVGHGDNRQVVIKGQ